ncbi:MAG: hypothetical protein U1E16_09350 [Hyphomicrobiales bacterium]
MAILFIVQTYTGFNMAWATPDTIATIIGFITPALVWAIPTRTPPENELAGGRCGCRVAPRPRGWGVAGGAATLLLA